ncbi:YecR family lipoprotein [Roseateles sp. L2-2]|uniref:YecR family lipoprotein n=1 Tax=Roseateles sp. L2-2 TaxID=3422597 RepID=UPI003D36743F
MAQTIFRRDYCLAACATALSLALTACAVNKQLIPTGGSRADGIVRMSYEYGGFENPKVDLQQGLSSAQQRCGAWGYSGAEPFGGGTRACTSFYQGTCNAWRVTVEYQCTGTPPASR